MYMKLELAAVGQFVRVKAAPGIKSAKHSAEYTYKSEAAAVNYSRLLKHRKKIRGIRKRFLRRFKRTPQIIFNRRLLRENFLARLIGFPRNRKNRSLNGREHRVVRRFNAVHKRTIQRERVKFLRLNIL